MSGLISLVSDPIAALAAEITLKSAVVLVLAGVAGLALCRSRAAARHQVWALGLAFLAVLPILVLAMPGPRIPLEILPAPRAAAVSTERPQPARGELLDRLSLLRPGDASVTHSSRTIASTPVAPSAAFWSGRRATALLVTIWALGSLLLLARLVSGLLRARSLVERGCPLESADLDLARGQLGIARKVALVSSDEVSVPMTTGIVRPVLVVPSGFSEWSPERRRLVLLHELAHVRRGDWLVQLLSDLGLALHWFQPLGWIAARRLREEAEVAADDVVIGLGETPSNYASHLVAIVRGARPETALPAVRMGVTPLERRLRALLAVGRPEGTWRARAAAPIVAVLVVSLLAGARLGAAPRADEEEPEPQAPATHATSESGMSADEVASFVGSIVLEAARKVKQEVRDGGLDHEYVKVRAGRQEVGGEDEKEADELGREDARDAMHSDRAAAAYDRAQRLHGNEEYERAVPAWKEAIRLGHRRPTAMYNLACSYARLGDGDAALEWLERAIEAGFDVAPYIERDDDLASLRSSSRFEELRREHGQGDRERLQRRIEQLERSKVRDFDTWYGLGKELHGVGDYEGALRSWQRSLELSESSAAAYNVACAQARLGETRAALDSLERSIEMGFGDDEFMEKDADLDSLRDEARYARAVEAARALELPDGAGSWIERNARSLFALHPSRREWERAKVRYESYLETHPQSGRAWFNVGFARLRMDDPGGAAEAFERAYELGHRKGTTAYNVACSYAANGDKDEAFEWLDRARKDGFDQEGLLASDPDLDNLRDDPRFPKTQKTKRGKLWGLFPESD